MKRAIGFTIWHGIVASVALHAALALPFVVNDLTPPPDDLPPLVIELQGMVSNAQIEERVAQQMSDQPQQQAPTAPPPPQQAPPPPEPEESAAVKPPEPQMAPQPQATPLAKPVKDPDEQQKAQVIKTEKDLEADRLREYVKALTKKVRDNLNPDDARKAGLRRRVTAAVSFAVAGNGGVRPGTLKVVRSSGHPQLDASAMVTVRACAPFPPPPREVTLTIEVDFFPKS